MVFVARPFMSSFPSATSSKRTENNFSVFTRGAEKGVVGDVGIPQSCPPPSLFVHCLSCIHPGPNCLSTHQCGQDARIVCPVSISTRLHGLWCCHVLGSSQRILFEALLSSILTTSGVPKMTGRAAAGEGGGGGLY